VDRLWPHKARKGDPLEPVMKAEPDPSHHEEHPLTPGELRPEVKIARTVEAMSPGSPVDPPGHAVGYPTRDGRRPGDKELAPADQSGAERAGDAAVRGKTSSDGARSERPGADRTGAGSRSAEKAAARAAAEPVERKTEAKAEAAPVGSDDAAGRAASDQSPR
jgi:hypothetical protein